MGSMFLRLAGPLVCVLAFALLPCASSAFAEQNRTTTVNAAAALYSDGSTSAMLDSVVLEVPNSLRVGASRRHTTGKSTPESPLTGNETAFTAGFDYEAWNSTDQMSPLNLSPRAGWLGAAAPGPKGESQTYSRWLGVAASIWTGEQTSRWTLDVQRTFTNSTAIDATDVDGKRILTPERIGGTRTAFSWMHLATPLFLWRGEVALTLRQDRPAAQSAKLDGRYFVTQMDAAVHSGISSFRNQGEVKPVTLTGTVTANSAFVEWHQKIGERIILAPGYRWYREKEVPRAANGEIRTLGSDHIYASVRYRAWQEYWLEDADETFVSAGFYQTSQPRKIWHVATGLKRAL